jgi:hypothetical protein
MGSIVCADQDDAVEEDLPIMLYASKVFHAHTLQGALKAWRQAQIASRLVGGGLNLLGHNAAAKRKEMERLSR